MKNEAEVPAAVACASCVVLVGVRVYTRRSDAPCELGRSWSYTSSEIVVWDGCRATFEFDMR